MNKFFLIIAFLLIIIGCGRSHRHSYQDSSDNLSTATTVAIDVSVVGLVDGLGDVDWYCVDLEGGKEYCFETFNLSAGLDTVLMLVDETGLGVIAENDDVDGESLRSKVCVIADYTGPHYLIVSFKDSQSGMYDILVANQLSDDGGDRHCGEGHGTGHDDYDHECDHDN